MIKNVILFTFMFAFVQTRTISPDISRDEIQLVQESFRSWEGNDKLDSTPEGAENESVPSPPVGTLNQVTTTTTVAIPASSVNATALPTSTSGSIPSTTTASQKPVKLVVDCTKFCRRRKRNNSYRKGPCSKLKQSELCLICRYVFYCGRSTKYF